MNQYARGGSSDPDEPVPIEERVRFWQEQDVINQELIPRVIRQHKLLTDHIREHDNLHGIVAGAVQEAVAVLREEDQRRYETALESARAALARQASESVAAEVRRLKNTLFGFAVLVGIVAFALSALITLILTQ